MSNIFANFKNKNSINSFVVSFIFEETPNTFYLMIVSDKKGEIYFNRKIVNDMWFENEYYKFFKYNIKLLSFDGDVVKLIDEKNFNINEHKFRISLVSENDDEIKIWKNYLYQIESTLNIKLDIIINNILENITEDITDSIEISRIQFDKFLKSSNKPLTCDYSSLIIIKTLFDILDK